MIATTTTTTAFAPATAQLAATLSAITYLGQFSINELRRHDLGIPLKTIQLLDSKWEPPSSQAAAVG